MAGAAAQYLVLNLLDTQLDWIQEASSVLTDSWGVPGSSTLQES